MGIQWLVALAALSASPMAGAYRTLRRTSASMCPSAMSGAGIATPGAALPWLRPSVHSEIGRDTIAEIRSLIPLGRLTAKAQRGIMVMRPPFSTFEPDPCTQAFAGPKTGFPPRAEFIRSSSRVNVQPKQRLSSDLKKKGVGRLAQLLDFIGCGGRI